MQNSFFSILKVRINPQKFSFFIYIILWLGLLYTFLKIYYKMEYESKGILNFLFAFYPLFFLPLFINEQKKTLTHIKETLLIGIEFSIAFLLFSFSLYKEGYLSLSFMTSYWMGLIGFRLLGVEFLFLSRFLILLCPPFSQKWSLIFGSSLRISLTEKAAKILNFITKDVKTEGNLIFLNQEFYTVDPECEGLKMLTALVFFHFLSLALWHNKSLKLSHSIYIFFIIPASILLWYITNLVRIIALALGKIRTESFWHEGIGIILFLSMVVFPICILYIIIGDLKINENTLSTKANPLPLAMMLLFLVFSRFHPKEPRSQGFNFPDQLNDLNLEEVDDRKNIASYSNSKYRLIVKKNLDYFRVSHHPRHCWTSSGYRFLYETSKVLETQESIQMAQIEKSGRTYDLYWWYQSESSESTHKTGSEWKWRYDAFLKNKNFTQINLILEVNQNQKDILDLVPKELENIQKANP